MNPLYVAYDSGADSISVNAITLQIRDFVGVSDSLALDNRPASLTDVHKYNLYNQGWYATGTSTSPTVQNVVDIWHSGHPADYPSNTDVWWVYKNSLDQFDTASIDKYANTNSPAPKGHYILDAFFQNRSAASGVIGLPSVGSSYFRPSTGTFFAGRVFYSGVSYLEFTNKVYFSPIIERPAQLGQCYQQNDPTSENLFDLLATDGGVLQIPEAGTIYRLFPVQNSLLVFASNGIWSISGNQGIGFTANDFTVKFIAQVAITGPLSFVNVEGLPVWWAEGGIYAITGTDQLGSIGLANLTNGQIKTFFNNIPNGSKIYAKGAYNFQDKIIQWVWSSEEPGTNLERYQYDRVLNYNTLTKAYYTWSVAESDNLICGITTTRGLGAKRTPENVTNIATQVVTTISLDPVTTDIIETVALPSTFRFTTIRNTSGSTYGLSFAQERDGNYLDWASTDSPGVDYTSYFVSGYKVHGDAQRRFQPNYIYVFLIPSTNSACYLNVIADWAGSATGPYHSPRQQVYPTGQVNRDYQYNRLKVRSTGLATQLKFSSVSGKPFGIIGWSIFESGNSSV
jgi:hypothetical protein